MDNKKQQQVNQDAEDASLLKQRETLHRFMRECLECQQEVEPHWQTCAYCGTRLETSCPGCGNPLPPAGAQSCPNCGLAIPQVDT